MTDATAATAYKILTADEMATLEQDGRFEGSPADRQDGFIHLSTADQLEATLARHFASTADLHLVAIDVDALGDRLRWEPARGGELFPHYYGALTLDTVTAYSPLARHADGSLRLPVTG